MLAELVKWLPKLGLVLAFTGVAIGTCTSFLALSPDQKRKCRAGLIASLVFIAIGTILAISAT